MGKLRTLTMEQCLAIRGLREASGLSWRKIGEVHGVSWSCALRAYLRVGGPPSGANGRRLAARMQRKVGRPRTGSITGEGYRQVAIDASDPFYGMGRPYHGELRSILEHRLVLARKLGRALLRHETVHHKDGDKMNNAPDNLELRVGRHGKGASSQHCASCTCFTYGT